MIRVTSLVFIVAAVLAGCSSAKPIVGAVGKPIAETRPAAPVVKKEKEVKFLENITVAATDTKPVSTTSTYTPSSGIEKTSTLQVKYAALLNTPPELLSDLKLLEFIDEWYGTRYQMGGTSKSGIDCSAFVQTIYSSAFGVSLPRTAREQFRVSRIISATDLQEGDLLFFNTTGGVSHVGIYLMNNKFVHASSSKGVTVSDVFDPYYLRKYLGAGRIEKPAAISH